MQAYPVIDGHNDLAWACRETRGYGVEGLLSGAENLHTDLPRLAAGNVVGQFWSVWVDPVLEGTEQVLATLEQIDFVRRFVDAYPDRLRFTTTANEVRAAMSAGRIASLIGIEGGAQIGGSLAALRQYARLGARYMTLTWSETTSWADSATDRARHEGLTEFGRGVVREMNRIGMLVDLAHVSPRTMRDALAESALPVMVSHSSAWQLCKHPRNVPDDVLRSVGERDGVVMVAFVPSFLSEERRAWVEAGQIGAPPPVGIADIANHVEYVRELAGVHAVGLGADYDGTDAMPIGLEDVSGYPRLFDELERRGWSETDLLGLSRDNVLRVIESADGQYHRFLTGDAGAPEELAIQPGTDTALRKES